MTTFTAEQLLTDVIALARFALNLADSLEPFAADVDRRFNLWLGREKKAGREYTDEQMRWLTLVKEHVAANAEITPGDLQDAPAFAALGGRIAANRTFGRESLPKLLDDISDALVA